MATLEHHEHLAEPSLLDSERFAKGGRDTVIVVWSLIALAVAVFFALLIAVGEQPLSTNSATPSSAHAERAAAAPQ